METKSKRKQKKVNIGKIVRLTVIGLLLYIIVFSVSIFAILVFVNKKSYNKSINTNNFFAGSVGADSVVLVEENSHAELTRLNFLNNAQDSIKVAVLCVSDDYTGRLFISQLINAAEEGVKVEIIINNIHKKLLGSMQEDLEEFSAYHPNFELRYFESFNIFKPWSLQNTLHDKLIVVDSNKAITGGRNIENRFSGPPDYKGTNTRDREVAVFTSNYEQSVIKDIDNYFYELWNYKHNKVFKNSVNQDKNQKFADSMLKLLQEEKAKRGDITQQIDWQQQAIQANKITLSRNPITRLKKEPRVLMDINALINNAKNSVFLQSPYLVMDSQIQKYLNFEKLNKLDTTFLTNANSINPNITGRASYARLKPSLIRKNNFKIYEYQGPTSIHAKSFMIDDDITGIGSFNLNPRSAFLSTESMLIIHSKEFASLFKQTVTDNTLNNSLLVKDVRSYHEKEGVNPTQTTFSTKVLDSVVGFFSYFFIYMF